MTPAALLDWVGRLHPAFVHLPIGFLLLLAIAEVAGGLRPAVRPTPALRTLALSASLLAAAAAAACGWLLGRSGEYDPALLDRHRWTGLGFTALTVALLVLRRRPGPYACTFVTCLVTLGFTGHFGGSLTHGEGYLALPTGSGTAPRTAIASAGEAGVFEDVIHPILQQRCVACHGPSKSNGGLRYDTAAAVLRGGKSGPLLRPGNPPESLLLTRLHLPLEAKEHMPPKGKPQPSEVELRLLEWWIHAGAPVEGKVADHAAPARIIDDVAARLALPAASTPDRALMLAEARNLEQRLGIVIRPLSQDSPWLEANARLRAGGFTDEDLRALASIAPAVARLDLGGTAVSDVGLAAVGAMARLQRLQLDHTRINGQGLHHLSGLAQLESLNLVGTPVGDDAVAALARLPALRTLYVWQTALTDDALNELVKQRTNPRRRQQLLGEIAELEARMRHESLTVHRGAVAPAVAPAGASLPPPSYPTLPP